MKILNEIAGSIENRIVYESNGEIAVLRRPSRVSLDEMRAELTRRESADRAETAARAAADEPAEKPAAAAERPVSPRKSAPRAGSGRR